jgi:hypothetical protein
MRAIRLAPIALAITVACAPPLDTAVPSATPGATNDADCATRTVASLVDAVNTADEARLAALLDYASFGIAGHTYATAAERVDALVTRSRAGERWHLESLQVYGRGWAGGIGFSWRLRRASADVTEGVITSYAKGELDCPEGRIRILLMS